MKTNTLSLLAHNILKHQKALIHFFEKVEKQALLPFYCSVDLRDSGFKVVPVDSNLYPAGFNNICPDDLRTAPPIFKKELQKIAEQEEIQNLKKILILPEPHTQNLFYIENLFYLHQIIQNAGFDVRIGWYDGHPESAEASMQNKEPIHLRSFTGKHLQAFPIQIEAQNDTTVLSTQDFTPDLILLNNDFSRGYPKAFDTIQQPIIPSYTLGWHSRKKSEHFRYYNQLANEFASIIDIDPWIVQIDTEEVTPVNFNQNQGIEQVADVVERILSKTKQAYDAHQIQRQPFAFIKNNAGTYGMGIMVVHSSDELKHLNRRIRNKMSVGKNHRPIESVIIQEGIPTATVVNQLAAEPVIYLAGSELVGGFLRSHTERGEEENLNTPGMIFKKLCMSDLREVQLEVSEDRMESSATAPTLELVYGTIAKLSTLAAGLELRRHLRTSRR